jgi:catechol 2,3-dioxygenase-like lactoylglutathione lyase family enzyme
MKPSFVAGFGPIVRDGATSRAFWSEALGLDLEEIAPDYFGNDELGGIKAFALWPLGQAAQACFGLPAWPADIPVPQAWIEFDVASADAVGAAVVELRAAGQRVITEAHLEPWGQTTARLLSPEGLLVGVVYTPWMHSEDAPATT